MKSSTIIRTISVTSLTLSPAMKSSAFVLGMRRHHQRDLNRLATTRLHDSRDRHHFEFDFIEAATRAAIEREAREEHASHKIHHKVSTYGEKPDTEMTLPSEEDDHEFDFIAAATRAAVERDNIESRAKKFATKNARRTVLQSSPVSQ